MTSTQRVSDKPEKEIDVPGNMELNSTNAKNNRSCFMYKEELINYTWMFLQNYLLFALLELKVGTWYIDWRLSYYGSSAGSVRTSTGTAGSDQDLKIVVINCSAKVKISVVSNKAIYVPMRVKYAWLG